LRLDLDCAASGLSAAKKPENGIMDRIRVDKWLCAARFFKTRSLAARACELDRIECNGQKVKPAREVRAGDRLRVRTEGGEFQVDVLQVSDVRGPAPVAQTLYQETEASRELRKKMSEELKAMANVTAVMHEGRPSKRDRRKLDRFRQRM